MIPLIIADTTGEHSIYTEYNNSRPPSALAVATFGGLVIPPSTKHVVGTNSPKYFTVRTESCSKITLKKNLSC